MALVQPKITYQWESFRAIMKEIIPLFIEHWRESIKNKEQEPLDVNFSAYLSMEASGALKIFTTRHDSVLTGYIFFILSPNLNSRGIINAGASMYFLLKKFRKGYTGFKLFRKAEATLKLEYNVNDVFIHEHAGNGILLRRLGYQAIETVHKKRL